MLSTVQVSSWQKKHSL